MANYNLYRCFRFKHLIVQHGVLYWSILQYISMFSTHSSPFWDNGLGSIWTGLFSSTGVTQHVRRSSVSWRQRAEAKAWEVAVSSVVYGRTERGGSLFACPWKARLSSTSDLLRLEAKPETEGAFAECRVFCRWGAERVSQRWRGSLLEGREGVMFPSCLQVRQILLMETKTLIVIQRKLVIADWSKAEITKG